MRKTLLLSISIFLLYSCNLEADLYNEKITQRTKKNEISGVVINKFDDWDNHGSPRVVLQNDTLSVLEWCQKSDFWDFIQIGDSIYKPSGSLNLKVIKPTGETKEYEYNLD